jgi:hypothetical protein
MEENKQTNADNLKNALNYLPFVWIWLFFTETKKTPLFKKHNKYWNFIFIWFILIRFVVTLLLPLWGLLFVIYAWIAWFLGYKAYNWEDMDVEYIDNFEEKIKENLK